MGPQQSVIVVGGNIAALNAIEALRSRGYEGRLTMVSAENDLPYHRPPLSKTFLLRGEAPAFYRDRTWFEDNAVELRLGTSALGLDVAERRLVTEEETLQFDGLVVATGCRPRPLGGPSELEGVFTIRTLDDAIHLREALLKAPRLVVVGAGFIGLEVAASARMLGLDVTVLESAEEVMERVLGPLAGRVLAEIHRARGVDIRYRTRVREVGGRGRVEYVELADGQRLPADVVVVAIGVMRNVEWLADSGLSLRDGVACAPSLCAGPSNIFAAGDAACWRDPHYGLRRSEQWTTAARQGQHAGTQLLHAESEPCAEFSEIPYFWSDQYETKLQLVGVASAQPPIRLPVAGKQVLAWEADGTVIGILGLDAPGLIAKGRSLLARRGTMADLLAAAA